jgi:signal peptidase I
MAGKSLLKKIWNFIWHEDSLLSWIVNVILAFLIIKFLIYPGLGFFLGTPAPIVAVVSGSMEHEKPFDDWWNSESCCDFECSSKFVQGDFYEKLNISKDFFASFPFVFGFDKGDIMVLHKRSEIKVGDVIVYNIKEKPDPIIHRVIGIKEENNKKYYATKGDNNCGIADFEKVIPENAVIGKASIRVPFLGWIKIFFVGFINLFV